MCAYVCLYACVCVCVCVCVRDMGKEQEWKRGENKCTSRMSESRLSSLIHDKTDTIAKKSRITRRSKKLRGQPQGLPVSLRM